MTLAFRWTDDGVMVPLRPNLADAEFCVGEVYFLDVAKSRNMSAHRANFAEIAAAWKNLPEGIADQFASPEHLRARALVEAGYCTERLIDAGSKAAAERVAAYVRGAKEFAHVVTRGPIVVIKEPESQSVRAMGADRFKASMQAVQSIVASMIGVTPDTLAVEAERGAA